MEKCITYVGLDVHKNSIDIALADGGRDNEVRHYGTIGGDLAALGKIIRKLVSKETLSALLTKQVPAVMKYIDI